MSSVISMKNAEDGTFGNHDYTAGEAIEIDNVDRIISVKYDSNISYLFFFQFLSVGIHG